MTADKPAVHTSLEDVRDRLEEHRELRAKLARLRHEMRAWATVVRTNRELLRTLWRTLGPSLATDGRTGLPET